MEKDTFEIEELMRSIELLSADLQPRQEAEPPADPETDFSADDLAEQGFAEPQIDEIETGTRQGLSVRHYARLCYNWKQMREIRLGLLEGLDVSKYDNHLFSAEQMHEIRLGLIDHLDVSVYANLILSTIDMANARRELLGDAYRTDPTGHARLVTDEDTGIEIRLNDNCMHAYLRLPEGRMFSVAELEHVLNRNDITSGIDRKKLTELAEHPGTGEEVRVAAGKKAQRGKDGRYEYYFNAELPDEPRVNEDGTVDYTHLIVADKRKAGDVLAKYHPAKPGRDGETVTGVVIHGTKGTEQPALHGQGIRRKEDQNLYVAAESGHVVLDAEKHTLNVWNVYVVDGDVNRYNGQIRYNGVIHVRGNVCDMARIEATGNVVVDGYVESAYIRAGENIILRSGMNAGNGGALEAGGKVIGKFFEETTITAGGNVEANYFMNCYVTTDKSVLAKGTKSRILGGRIKAGYAVEAYTIQNSGRQAATVDAGDPVWLGKRMHSVAGRLEKVEDELRQLSEGKEKISRTFGEQIPESNALFQKICIAIRMKEEERATLQQEKNYCDSLIRRAAKAYIKAHFKIQTGTVLVIRGKMKKTDSDLRGMITFE